ncbi:MAG: hypothetical protein JOZ85_00185 [Betaproteobacteria bacterium]|nr:hypothetical protein [Betaproteobacteria bacterium]
MDLAAPGAALGLARVLAPSMKFLNWSTVVFTWKDITPSLSPTFSITPCGSYSIVKTVNSGQRP